MEEINLRDFLIYLKKYILVFVAAALVAVGGTFIYNKNFKNKLLKALQNLLDNIDIIANNYNIADKRTGWWSELYRDKWNV